MAASTELSPQDVVRALQKLKTKELVFHLGVDTHVLDNIEARFNVRIYAIQAWLDRDTEASWEKIVSRLEQIGMNVLAKEVALQHCPQLSVATINSTDLDTSAAVHTVQPDHTQAEVALVMPSPVVTSTAVDSEQPLNPAAVHIQPLVVIVKVKATLLHLEKQFSGLITSARSALCDRESHDRNFLDEFRDHLLVLPVTKKATHVKFFRESEDDILDAKNIRKIFAILSCYWSYCNYEILLHLINSFCDAHLHKSMQDYCKVLEDFEKATTVDVYISAMLPDKELELAFSEMVVKIEKPASKCTLYEIRKLNEAITKGSSLSSHSIYISSVSTNCVVVVFRFPGSAVGWVLAGMTPDFMHTHHLREVALDGERLTVMEADREDLNDQLIDASGAGDVVRVASLLNSGADVETVGGKHSQTPLDMASWEGHLHTVRLLLQRGAKVESRDRTGYTPLVSAAYRGSCDVAIELLENGADIDIQTDVGDSALIRAAYCGKTEVVVELVKAGANLDLQDTAEDSALMLAAYLGINEVAVELVKAGANLNLQNTDGDSALMLAAWMGKTEVVMELAKAGANLNLQNTDGDSALMQAANTEVAVELVTAGANLNLQNAKGDSAVIRATAEHESGALQVLVRAGADLNLQNEEGLTALMISAMSGRTELTDILLTGQNIDTDIQEYAIISEEVYVMMSEGILT